MSAFHPDPGEIAVVFDAAPVAITADGVRVSFNKCRRGSFDGALVSLSGGPVTTSDYVFSADGLQFRRGGTYVVSASAAWDAPLTDSTDSGAYPDSGNLRLDVTRGGDFVSQAGMQAGDTFGRIEGTVIAIAGTQLRLEVADFGETAHLTAAVINIQSAV